MPGYMPKPPFCILQRDHPLAQGLVGAWAFDVGGGGKHVQDMSGRGNHGTAQAFNKWVGGAFGWCMDFNGSTDYVDCGNDSSLNPTEMSLTAFIWRTNDTNNANWVITRDDDVLGRAYSLGPNKNDSGNRLELQINGAATIRNQGIVLQLEQWYMIAAVGSSSIGWITYVNGEPQGSAAWAAPASTTGATNIGRRTYSGYEEPFEGVIDDVRIYNRALSAEEIAAIYHDPWEIYRPREMTLRAQCIVAALYRMLRRRAR